MAAFARSVDSEGVATLTFDIADAKVNTFTRAALEELDRQLSEIEAEVSSGGIKALIIESGKPGSFIAGADIKLIEALDDSDEAAAAAGAGQEMFARIQDLAVPTLAAIGGTCLGGGLELALACDYRTASDHPKTQIGLPETQLGVLPGWGGTFRLPRIVGLRQATKMILAGSTVDGARALRIGLVDAVFPEAFFAEWTRELMGHLMHAGRDRRVDTAREKARKRRSALLEGTGIGRTLLFNAASKDLNRRTGGHYPAPVAALKVLRTTATGSLASRSTRSRAHAIERAAFGRLAVTRECKALISLFFAREASKRHPALKDATPDRSVRRAAVLGAGVMGGRIAWLLSNREIPVAMRDIAWDAVQKGYRSAKDVYDKLVSRRKLEERVAALRLNLIHGTTDLEAIGNPDIVIEAVVERMEVKKAVLAEVEPRLRADAILATNTSALSIDEMASALERPERFVGMHFFNPVDRMPLVEVIRGAATAPSVVGDTVKLALALGKTPVVVNDSPGFLVNRLLLPYLNEAAVMLGEGVNYTAADRLFTDFGMPMGPYTLLDEVGLDVGFHVAETLHQAFGERMATAHILDRVREHPELFGKKAGAGFYLYKGGKRTEPNPAMVKLVGEEAAAHAHAGHERSGGLSDRDLFDRAMFNMINEAAYALDAGIVADAQQLDLAMIMGTGFPPFRGGLLRWADEVGSDAVVGRLRELERQYGMRFKPAPYLERLAEEGRGFYPAAG